MQIHELAALGRTPTTGDSLAIDTGSATVKIDYNALATAILDKLGAGNDGVVDIAHGGTGVETAADARTSLAITPANIGAVAASSIIDIAHGGTGAETAADARTSLGITPANIGAVAASSIIDIAHGGTNATTAAAALTALGAAASYTKYLNANTSVIVKLNGYSRGVLIAFCGADGSGTLSIYSNGYMANVISLSGISVSVDHSNWVDITFANNSNGSGYLLMIASAGTTFTEI